MANSKKRKRTRRSAVRSGEERPAARSGAKIPPRGPAPLGAPESANSDEPPAPPVIRPLTPEAWHRGLALAMQIEEEERALVMPEEDETRLR